MKKIDNTPILDMKTDWGDPDGTGEKAKSLEQVQKFIKKKILELEVRMLSITHSELVALRNNSQLIPGMKYRITDYTIRDDFEGTIDNISSDVKYGSQGLVFDIIVTASSNNSLYEEAQAVEHEYLKGETHNPNECDYPKWKLKYTIDNDNPKYSWSDPLGKGVIYEMKDEYGNVCPYDFKNIGWYFTEEKINNFDNQVIENGVEITGLTNYFTPNIPILTFNGECKNNVITFEYDIVPIIIQDSHNNKIIIESSSPDVTFINNSYYSELHSRSTTNIYPFLQQQHCYSEISNSTLYKCPYLPSSELGDSDSLTVSQKTITENFKNSKDIISFTAFESITPIIHNDSPNNNNGTVVYNTNQNIFLYKIHNRFTA